MKNKYNTYNNDHGNYVDINDWTTYDPETKEERLAREKVEKRNDKINSILND